MPRYHRDELAKLDDIEVLLITARDLALRFRERDVHEVTVGIQTALGDLRSARITLIDRWRLADQN